MAVTKRPRVLTQQPQGAVQIDWSNPLARGLVLAQVGDELSEKVNNKPAGNYFEDGPRPPSIFANTGRGLNFSGGPYELQFDYFKPGQKPTTAFSILTITKPVSNQAANTAGYILQSLSNTNQAQWGLDFYVSSFTTNGFGLNVRNSGGFSYGTNAPVGDNYQFTKPLIVSGSAGTTQNSKIYLNGELKGVGGTLNDFLFQSNELNNSKPYMGSYNGSTYLNLIWNRTLTDSEHLQLAQNPWQLFKPAAGRTYFLPANRSKFLFLFN